MDQRILVTGATGLVGNNLVRQLLENGEIVRAVAFSNSESIHDLNVEVVSGDVLDRDFLASAMEGIELVYHLAAVISFDGSKEQQRMRNVNVQGTANVVNCCLKTGVKRLVHFSSIHAFSHLPLNEAIDETRRPALGPEHLPYDQSKAEAEKIVLKAVKLGLDAVIVNPTWIFGPNDFGPSPSGEFFLQLVNRKLPALVNAGYFCVDVRDVVAAAISAATVGRSGERYILAGQYATFRQLADWMYEASGSRPPSIDLPIWLASAAAPVVELGCRMIGQRPLITPDSIKIVQFHQKIETDKAAIELGFSSRPLQETVCDTIKWLQENHQSN